MCFRIGCCFGDCFCRSGNDFGGTPHSSPPHKTPARSRNGNGNGNRDHKGDAGYAPHPRKSQLVAYSDDEAGRKNLHDAPAHREEEAAPAYAYPADHKAYHHDPAYTYRVDKPYHNTSAAVSAFEPPRPAVARNNNNTNKVAHDNHAGGGYKTDHESAMAMVYHYPAPTTNTLASY